MLTGTSAWENFISNLDKQTSKGRGNALPIIKTLLNQLKTTKTMKNAIIKIEMKKEVNKFRSCGNHTFHVASTMTIKKNAFSRFEVYLNGTIQTESVAEFNTISEAKQFIIDTYFDIWCSKKNK